MSASKNLSENQSAPSPSLEESNSSKPNTADARSDQQSESASEADASVDTEEEKSAQEPPFKRIWMQMLKRFLPANPEDAMRDIFARLRKDLPTPCIVLVGEPQVGKSSVVRTLTGDPKARIGLGDGIPVTQQIEAYPFPPQATLPLWIFLDTPGVGTKTPILEQEAFETLLRGKAQFSTSTKANKRSSDSPSIEAPSLQNATIPAPHMLLACIRADDRELALQPWLESWAKLGKKTDTPLPLLVVQTCLHRILHPHPSPYPFGEKGDVLPETLPQEVAKQLQTQREKIRELVPDANFVVVDLTDPDDEVGDPFYGAEPLVEAVLAQLPETIARIMRTQRGLFDDAFDIQAQRLIWSYATMAAAAGALPPPVGDIGTLAVSVALLRQLAAQYRQPWEFRTVLDLLWSLGSTTLLWIAARYLLRRIPIPFLMIPLGAAGAFTLVFSVGQLMAWYYAHVREGHQPTAEDVRQHWEEVQTQSKEQWKQAFSSLSSTSSTPPKENTP